MDNNMGKVKTVATIFIFAFVAVFCFACISFVNLNKIRKQNASYNSQIEELIAQKNALQEQIDYYQTQEGQNELAKQQGNQEKDTYNIKTK